MAHVHLLQQWWQEVYKTTWINPFLFSLILCSFLFLLKSITRVGSTLNLPPSPPRLPVIGHLHRLGTLPHRSLRALSKKYGPILLLYLGCAPTLVVTSAELAKEIMKNQDIVFANRPRTWAADRLLYGYRLLGFSPYGEYWRQMRSLCVLKLLTHKSVQSFHFIREEEVAELIEKIRGASRDRALVNLGEMFVHISNSIISRCVLGRKYGEDNKKRTADLVTVMDLVGEFCFRDFIPSLGWMDVLTGFVKRVKDNSEGIDAFLDKVIEECRSSKGTDDQQDTNCFAELLLRLPKDMLKIDITEIDVKAVLLAMLVGGTDTSSTVMEWAMTHLMKNPTTMKKAQDEVRRVVGKKTKIDQDDIDQMGYLKCVVKEALRLHAPVPFLIPRETTESTKLEGYDIPPKTRVYINVWAIQRDPKLWDRPEEFLPERFANNPIDFKGQDFHFIPFGSGRRICPGITFGVVESEYVLANLLFWFDWKFPGGAGGEDLDMDEIFGLVVHKKIPLQLVPVLHFPESLQ